MNQCICEIVNWRLVPMDENSESYKNLGDFYDFIADSSQQKFIFSEAYSLEGETRGHSGEDDGTLIKTTAVKEVVKNNDNFFAKTETGLETGNVYRLQNDHMARITQTSMAEHYGYRRIIHMPSSIF